TPTPFPYTTLFRSAPVDDPGTDVDVTALEHDLFAADLLVGVDRLLQVVGPGGTRSEGGQCDGEPDGGKGGPSPAPDGGHVVSWIKQSCRESAFARIMST